MGFLSGRGDLTLFVAIKIFTKYSIMIQGPPGTGKTQTILGLLSVVLHSTPVRQAFK